MLLEVALLMLVVCLFGVLGPFDIGKLVHVLLVGLMLLILGALIARDAAAGGSRSSDR